MSTPASSYILALDHGTSGCKVALVDIYGNVIDSDHQPTPIHFFGEGGAEQSPHDWWNAFLAGASNLVKRHPEKARQIVAIGVSSTFSSTVAVDSKGQPLMNAITWMDARGAPYIRKVTDGFPKVQGYGLAKMLRWIYLTGGGPSLSGKDDIAHVLLVKHTFPEIYEKTYKFLGSKDYFNLRLTGEMAATFDSVTLFWLTNNRDINNIHYADSLIALSGIDKDKLPPLIRSTDVVGKLLPDVAAQIGISPGIPVFGGSPDHQSALIGSGAVEDFQGHLYIGTSSWIECILPFKKTDVIHSIASLPTAIPGKYQCINEQDIAGGALSFLLNNIIFHKSHFYEPVRPENPYERLDATVKHVPAGSHKLIFAPWLNGERSPVDSTTLRGVLYNIGMTTNADHILRSVLEGVAYNTRWSLQYVEQFIGRKMYDINLIGGGGQSDVWCQIFADVLQRNIRRVKNPIQANARGAALIASVGMGNIRFEDIPQLTVFDGIFTPDSSNKAVYDELFQTFVQIFRKNQSIFDKLNRSVS